jgi:hypothetical protein
MPPSQEHMEATYSKLYGRISKTASNRFYASRRLKAHNTISLWTISLFSLGLILVSLLQALSVPLGLSDKLVNLVQVLLSVAILIISIIVSMSNYGVRSEQFHACGLELNAMALKLERVENQPCDKVTYDELTDAYETVLKRYSNHETIDYLMMKTQKYEFYNLGALKIVVIYIRFFLHFLPYVILLALECLWIYKLLTSAFRHAV